MVIQAAIPEIVSMEPCEKQILPMSSLVQKQEILLLRMIRLQTDPLKWRIIID